MKKMLRRLNRREGFTLAELLIVVAIIAVLVAISIPVFTTQLQKSQLATDTANVRAAYAESVATALVNQTIGDDGALAVSIANPCKDCTPSVDNSTHVVTVKHKKANIQETFTIDAKVTLTITGVPNT